MTQDSSRQADDVDDDITPDEDGEPTERSDTAAPEEGNPADKELSTLRKRLHDTQKKLHEVTTERAKLAGVVEGMGTRDAKPESKSDPFDGMDEAEVIANPYLIVERTRNAHKSLIADVAQVIRQIRDELDGKIQSQHPERIALQAEIDELKEDPDLADLDDNALLRIAKRNRRIAREAAPLEEEEDERPMRTLAGGGRASGGKRDPRKSPLFQAIYGDRFNDDGGGK